MSVVTQGWGDPFAPLTGGYGAPAPAWLAVADPSRLAVPWWWQSVSAWSPWPATVAPVPALWCSWWWSAPLSVPAHAFRSARGLDQGVYRYQSSGGGPMGAQPTGTTPHTVTLRTRDKFVPFVLSFVPDVAGTDQIADAAIVVLAHPAAYPAGPGRDVTALMLMGQQQSGTSVTAILGNANAVPGTAYSIEVVAVMASGLVLQETIGDGNPTRVICDG